MRELIDRIVEIIITVVVGTLCVNNIPVAAAELSTGWVYALLGASVLMSATLMWEVVELIDYFWDLMDWEDWGL